MQKLHSNTKIMGLKWLWLRLLLYLPHVGTTNDLALYRIPMNNQSINITNFKLRLVRSIVNKRIKAVPCSPKELIHQLVISFMNNIARHLCDYWDLISKKKTTRYKCKSTEWNTPLCIVRNHSGTEMGQVFSDLAHHTLEILIEVRQKYLIMSEKT